MGRPWALGLALAMVALAPACGDGDAATERSKGHDSSTTATAAAPVAPLRGTPGDAPDRPALAVKIDTTDGGRPQAGLPRADVVFEELVEGGLTRLLAVFHLRTPPRVGPVRSARTTDLPLLAELGRPAFAWSGANAVVAELVKAADVIDVGHAAVPSAYRRSATRPAPYDLFVSPSDLWAALPPDAEVPLPLFTYRPGGSRLTGAGVRAATSYRTTPGERLSTEIAWTWEPTTGEWLRSQDGAPHVTAEGSRVSVANVIVRETPYRDSGQRDAAGAVVPEAELVGEGDAWLLSGGRVLPGRWRKPAPDAPTTYRDGDGAPFYLAPGQTWVEVLPPGSGAVG